MPLASALHVKTAPAAFFPVVPAADALQKVPAVTVPDELVEPLVVFVEAAAFVVAVLTVVFVAFTVVAAAFTVGAAFTVVAALTVVAVLVVLVAASTGDPDTTEATRTKQATALSRRRFIGSMLGRIT